MLKPEEIPVEVLKAAIASWVENYYDNDMSYTKAMRLTIADAINAWPGLERIYQSEDEKTSCFILNMKKRGADV